MAGKDSLIGETHVPDLDYWKRMIACQNACPVHTDARGYVRAIAEGNDELAYLIARGPNPLASICGRVCGAPCETDCRRGSIDKPIAIRALKRFVCDKFGPESRPDGGRSLIEFLKDAASQHPERECQGKEELLPLLQSITSGMVPPVEGKSVGIIGSGPAGLAAAHDLALLGFKVTIYEMESVLAGMLATGIPEYRLPRALVAAEVEVILSLGVQAVTNCCVGRDITFPQLREQHDAVIIAAGAKRSRALPIPGSDAKGVLGGVEFLRDVSLGNPVEMGRRVVVIGGGNVAYDVGRTVLRQISLDAARTALREAGVTEVHLCSLESLDEMPADDIEIIEGDEEGIHRRNSLGPKEVLTDQSGAVCGVRFRRCTQVFNESRRFDPQFDDSDITDIECDTALIAIGQSFDLSFIEAERDSLDLMPNGLVKCTPDTGETNAPDVFVAGDLAYGPKLLIHAVASGKAVARAIYESVTSRKIEARDTELHFPIAAYSREKEYEGVPRVSLTTLSAAERVTSMTAVVEHGLSEAEARCEAGRCLNCGVNTIFDGTRCILCGGCAEVCPELCLRLVPLSALHGNGALQGVLDGQLDGWSPADASAIVKDETSCIRCALCAERCPTGAITMQQFIFKEELSCLDV
ncbi:MAG: FAD-dependent oxidoreductase [Verrucomicrobia bacterium]|nr:FAD-dependent oxidoreductase [Verrucomicrobiota bacterium]MDA1086564.1 FAD-dependent oxidoreductase [Verrucomicrobiota bacterium]